MRWDFFLLLKKKQNKTAGHWRHATSAPSTERLWLLQKMSEETVLCMSNCWLSGEVPSVTRFHSAVTWSSTKTPNQLLSRCGGGAAVTVLWLLPTPPLLTPQFSNSLHKIESIADSRVKQVQSKKPAPLAGFLKRCLCLGSILRHFWRPLADLAVANWIPWERVQFTSDSNKC